MQMCFPKWRLFNLTMFSENPGSYEKFVYVSIQGNYYKRFKLLPLYVWLSPVFWSLTFRSLW